MLSKQILKEIIKLDELVARIRFRSRESIEFLRQSFAFIDSR